MRTVIILFFLVQSFGEGEGPTTRHNANSKRAFGGGDGIGLARVDFHRLDDTYDREAQTLTGERSGLKLSVGQRVLTRLVEAVPVTGGLMLELIEVDGTTVGRSPAGGRKGSGPVARKRGKARKKSEKVAKAVRRRRK